MNKVALLLFATCVALTSAKDIPNFTAKELQDLSDPVLRRLGKVYAEVGAFTISDIPNNEDYQENLAKLVQDAPECFM